MLIARSLHFAIQILHHCVMTEFTNDYNSALVITDFLKLLVYNMCQIRIHDVS